MEYKAFCKALSIVLFSLPVLIQGHIAHAGQSPASAKTSADHQVSVEDYVFGQRIQFRSDILGETKDIYVNLPESYKEGTARYPVLYVLDGGDYFEPFAGMVKYLSLYEMIPELIVVAVAHGDRMKEFTFTKANADTGDWPTSGGAESFRRFLANELIPYVDSSYRTHSFRILAGHSLAGLFAVETLARSPNTFQATIALSPSLYWNQFEWLKNAPSVFGRTPDLKHFLFIMNEQKGKDEVEYLDDFKNWVATKGPKGLVYEFRSFPEEDHASVGFPGLFSSLKKLFQAWHFPEEAWETGPEKVKDHFRNLSERFGFQVPIPEEFLNGHARHGLERHKAPDEAIRLFEFCLSLYPKSVGAYEGLGDAYEQKGMREKAAEFYEKALALDPADTGIKNKLKKLKNSTSEE